MCSYGKECACLPFLSLVGVAEECTVLTLLSLLSREDREEFLNEPVCVSWYDIADILRECVAT